MGSEMDVSLGRTTNPMCPFSTQGIHSRRTFLQGIRIPADSMNLTPLMDLLEEGQEGPYYPIINRKFTYTPSVAITLGSISRELENKVFLQVFMHCEPIRSHHLRSRDSCMSFSQVMQEHPRWRDQQPNSRFFRPWRSGILIWR